MKFKTWSSDDEDQYDLRIWQDFAYQKSYSNVTTPDKDDKSAPHNFNP